MISLPGKVFDMFCILYMYEDQCANPGFSSESEEDMHSKKNISKKTQK